MTQIMEKVTTFLVWVAMALFLALCLCGCTGIAENLRDKTVNSGGDIYGLKVTTFDPSTGTMSPTGWIGFGGFYYHSSPIERGQPYKVTRRKKSFWSGEFSEEVIIECGAAPQRGRIEVKGGDILSIPVKPDAKFIKDNESNAD